MEIDPVSIEIIKHLRDGRKSFGRIAKDLGLAENTVRSRVSRLMKEGVLDITGVINPEAIPGHRVVIIGVKLNTLNLVKKAEEFSKLKGIISVSVVTGRYDLMLIVLLKEGFDLLEFYTNEVYKLKDVGSVETFVVYKCFNLMVPYVH